jgi:2-hydroxy-6-oxo-octa-2,4-dienoate hydrolase
LRMPALGVYGRGDKIVDPKQAKLFDRIANARVEMLARSRHFPMLDEPQEFHSILQSFVAE